MAAPGATFRREAKHCVCIIQANIAIELYRFTETPFEEWSHISVETARKCINQFASFDQILWRYIIVFAVHVDHVLYHLQKLLRAVIEQYHQIINIHTGEDIVEEPLSSLRSTAWDTLARTSVLDWSRV